MSVTNTLSALTGPFTTRQQILEVLQRDITNVVDVPIYDEYPSDTSKVRYGLYVSAPDTVSRSVNQLAVQYCGYIYEEVDEFDVLFVSFQEDPLAPTVNAIVRNILTSVKDDGTQLFDGYFSRTFDQTFEYGPTRAEIYTWIFSLTRLDFNT
jgi:hypothetical protein